MRMKKIKTLISSVLCMAMVAAGIAMPVCISAEEKDYGTQTYREDGSVTVTFGADSVLSGNGFLSNGHIDSTKPNDVIRLGADPIDLSRYKTIIVNAATQSGSAPFQGEPSNRGADIMLNGTVIARVEIGNTGNSKYVDNVVPLTLPDGMEPIGIVTMKTFTTNNSNWTGNYKSVTFAGNSTGEAYSQILKADRDSVCVDFSLGNSDCNAGRGYVAFYDDRGALLRIDSERLTLEGNQYATVSVQTPANAERVKTFLWKETTMAPLCEAGVQEFPKVTEEEKKLMAVTIDRVEPDNSVSEAAHNYNGTDSYQSIVSSGGSSHFYRNAWGSADASFSYDLKVDGTGQNYLYASYWGNSLAFSIGSTEYLREFNIYVDGVELKQQRVNGNIKRCYEIPRELTDGKSAVTVTFAVDSDTKCAGSVVELRTTREYIEPEADIQIDFADIDTSLSPYTKKFDQFTTTWNMRGDTDGIDPQTEALLPAISKLKPESMRVDMFMGLGGIGDDIANSATKNGSDDSEYSVIDKVSNALVDNHINPYYVYMANPVYCRKDADSTWKSTPDLEKWQEVCKNISAHFKKTGTRLGGHEIWNEPDYRGDYFSGTMDEYNEVYVSGAKGIREGDPDALVGGLSWASPTTTGRSHLDNFLAKVDEEKAPLDFVSWHYYGRNGYLDQSNNFENYIKIVRAPFEENPQFSTVQQHLNEFNLYSGGHGEYNYSNIVNLTVKGLERLLAATDVTRLSWAMAIDGGYLDIINKGSGERRMIYYGLWSYARLPLDRATVKKIGSSDINIMAGSDDSRAAAILCNDSNFENTMLVSFDGVRFDKGDLTAYTISAANRPEATSDEPVITDKKEQVNTDGFTYEVTIPANSTVYLELNDRDGTSETDKLQNVGKLVKKEYWYPQRGDNYAGSDTYEDSLTSYVWTGSVDDSQGTAVALTMDDMKDVNLKVNTTLAGTPVKNSDESQLGLKVDFSNGDGYTKSVYFPMNNIDGYKSIPLGKQANAADDVSELKVGENVLNLNAYAPDDWNGRVMLTMVANDCGKGVYAKFNFDK